MTQANKNTPAVPPSAKGALILPIVDTAFPGHMHKQSYFNVPSDHALISTLRAAKDKNQFVVLVAQKPDASEPLPETASHAERREEDMKAAMLERETWHDSARYDTGVLAMVDHLVGPLAGGMYNVGYKAVARVKLSNVEEGVWASQGDIETLSFDYGSQTDPELLAMTEVLKHDTLNLLKTLYPAQFLLRIKKPEAAKNLPALDLADWLEAVETPRDLAEFFVGTLHEKPMIPPLFYVPKAHKQELLEQNSVRERLLKMQEVLKFRDAMLKANDNIADTIQKFRELAAQKAEIDVKLTEVFELVRVHGHWDLLKNHLPKIPTGYGLRDDEAQEGGKAKRAAPIEKLEAKLKEKELSDDVREAVDEAFDKISRMHTQDPDYTKTLDYLKFIAALPWGAKDASPIKADLAAARKIMDDHHYGQFEVKDALLDHMAARIKSAQDKGKIICLIGPPGVGKTAFCKAMAEAMGRSFVRIAVGGLNDETIIRGHGRTYLGSKAGRIMDAMKQAGTTNPLILLDEIDKIQQEKVGGTFLELLDPEQNGKFHDNYLGEAYDLSKVMFVTSANELPRDPALISRMEMIEVPGYLPSEKLIIGKKFMLPKVAAQNGVHIDMSDAAMEEVIRHTNEAGVRKLEQHLEKLCKKVARDILEKNIIDTTAEAPLKIQTAADVAKYLGSVREMGYVLPEENLTGTVQGLSTTAGAGKILPIQGSLVDDVVSENSFTLSVSGNVKDMIKESIQAVEWLLRGHAEKLGIKPEMMKGKQLRVFYPDVGTPKDGPSAGIAMSVLAVSLLTGRQISRHVAMTGETDIHGNSGPVGGIMQKVMAAADAGCKKVLLPVANQYDVDKFPQDVKDHLAAKGVQIIPVKTVFEALSHALVDTPALATSFQHLMGKVPPVCPANDPRPCTHHQGPAASQVENTEPKPAMG